MAVSRIGLPARARRDSPTCTSMRRSFSCVVVVLRISIVTATADNASGRIGRLCLQVWRRSDGRRTGRPGGATVDPFRWPLSSVPVAWKGGLRVGMRP